MSNTVVPPLRRRDDRSAERPDYGAFEGWAGIGLFAADSFEFEI